MAKKQFTSNFQDIFKPTDVIEPILSTPQNEIHREIDENEKVVRTTILLKESTYNKIKAIAYWERVQIKDILDKALQSIICNYSEDQMEEIINLKLKNQK